MASHSKSHLDNFLDAALYRCKKAFIVTFFFSLAVNLLMLTIPLYSLQVLDRVISSASISTLLGLSFIMIAIFISLSFIQIARSLTLIRVGEWLDKTLAPGLLSQSIETAAIRPSVGGSQHLRDLSTLRNFLTSAGINTLFDAPWSLIYLMVIFVIHPDLGMISVAGAVSLFLIAVFNAYATEGVLASSNEHAIRSLNHAEISTRNAESIEAMGMMEAVIHNWYLLNQKSLFLQSIASNRNALISGFSKFLRLTLQVAITGVGAYLALRNELTVGGMIASSTLVYRALAPFESAIEMWKVITNAHKAYHRLKEAIQQSPRRNVAMSLPRPEGRLSVENVLFAPLNPNSPTPAKYTLRGVSFALEPGEILAIIGPSAAGKSSLAKLMTGIWKPLSGIIRLDGADVYTWNRSDFGQYVGYLPQSIELFSGTVKDNIARLQMDASPDHIVQAAQLAGAHEMILRLPNGYETDIGISGSALSAGQRQRIGLARAFFGDPRLIVLDEPNANLDEAGDAALVQALNNAKERKITTIVISHRSSVLTSVDKILVLQEGAVAAFGPAREILAKFARAQNPTIATQPKAQAVATSSPANAS